MRGNPISEFISDKLYFDLMAKGFLNERAIRDFYLKKQFNEMRTRHTPQQIFSLLHEEFPYICEDTIRKIIYTRNEMDQLLTSVLTVHSQYCPEYFEKKVG
jgi:hypothetical protein